MKISTKLYRMSTIPSPIIKSVKKFTLIMSMATVNTTITWKSLIIRPNRSITNNLMFKFKWKKLNNQIKFGARFITNDHPIKYHFLLLHKTYQLQSAYKISKISINRLNKLHLNNPKQLYYLHPIKYLNKGICIQAGLKLNILILAFLRIKILNQYRSPRVQWSTQLIKINKISIILIIFI